MENIELVRIDDRMLHGQVVSTWLKDYSIEQVLIINDKAANDPIQKSVAGLAAPKEVKVHLFGVDQFIDILKKTPIKRKTMLIFTTSTDVLKLVENGLDIKEVNVGGMRYNENRKKLSKAVSVTQEEEEAFKKLIEKDIKVKRHTLPYYIGVEKSIALFEWVYYLSYIAVILMVVFGILHPLCILHLLTLYAAKKNINTFKEVQDKETTFITAIKNYIIIMASICMLIFISSMI